MTMISKKMMSLEWKKKLRNESKNVGFIVISYAITILRYTIFYNLGCVMRKTSTKPMSANIKYTIFSCEIDTSNIKYIKIRKVGTQWGYSQLETTISSQKS